MSIKEKHHRLPRQYYQGEVSAAFTLCTKNRARTFIEPQIVDVFTGILSDAAVKSGSIVPVYCFMPDHQHVIFSGIHNSADVWQAVVKYKQKTGYWLSVNRPGIEWQKDFYDHVIKTKNELSVRVRYILDNPVRKDMVNRWEDYPFKGSVGCKLDDILNGIM